MKKTRAERTPSTAPSAVGPVPAGPLPPPVDPLDLARLLAGDHTDPHRILGAHPATVDGRSGVVVRAMHPDATGVECILAGGETVTLSRIEGGLFGCFLPGA